VSSEPDGADYSHAASSPAAPFPCCQYAFHGTPLAGGSPHPYRHTTLTSSRQHPSHDHPCQTWYPRSPA
jgi:hypothetical protein